MVRWLGSIRRLALLLCVGALAACGPLTPESQVSRYHRAIDRLDQLAVRDVLRAPLIQEKKAEFNAEFERVRSGTGEEGARAIAEVCRRVEAFEEGLNPKVPTTARPGQPGSKLGGVQGGAVMPVGGVPPTGGSGFGGGAAGAVPVGGVPPAAGNSGFGGGAAVPPAGAPVPAGGTGGSGFGGQ